MTKKAVLIGINYKNTQNVLKGCINDANNIKNIITQKFGYTAENIRLLTEDETVKPNRRDMEDAIKWLVSGCKPGDTLLFHYSGHGSRIDDTNKDETDGKDDVLVPLDYQTAGVIVDDWLHDNLASKVPAGATLWCFTDCCHSGTMIDLKYNYQSLCAPKTASITRGMPYDGNQWTDKFAYSIENSTEVVGNVRLFSGALDSQTAADTSFNGQAQGAFSYCIGQLLCEQNTNMKVHDVLKFVNAKLAINGYVQQCNLSLSRQNDIESMFSL
jgi:hypothetical protein